MVFLLSSEALKALKNLLLEQKSHFQHCASLTARKGEGPELYNAVTSCFPAEKVYLLLI